MSKNYKLMTDEVLAGLAQAGDREAEDMAKVAKLMK